MQAAMTAKPVAKRIPKGLEGFFGAFFRLTYFRPKERRTAGINIRITPSLERDLKVLSRLWSIASQVHSDDPELKVSENDAAFRLLEASASAAIAEMLGPDTRVPETDDEWKRAEATLRKRFSLSK